MRVTRKQFLNFALTSTAAATVFGCGDDPEAGGDGLACSDVGPGPPFAVCIGSNHQHALDITEADVTAGVAKTYEIRGGGTHGHELVITPAQFTRMAAGETLSLVAPGTAHDHTVDIIYTPPE